MRDAVVLGSRGVLKPGPLLWVRALLWAVLLYAVVFFLPSFFQVAGLLFSSGMDPQAYADNPLSLFDRVAPAALIGWTVATVLVAIGLYGALVIFGERRELKEFALREAPVELLAGLAIGALLIAAAIGAMWAVGAVTIAAQPMDGASRAISFAIQTGVLEEISLRLIVFRLLWRAFGLTAALVLSALLFGALHIVNPNASWFAALCIAVEAGVMLAAFYVLTGRIWVAIGVHAGWNFTQGWIFGAPVSGTNFFEGGPLTVQATPGAPHILSGGGFGPEASLAGLLIGTAAGVATLWLAWRQGKFRAADA